jgi:RimJ/RimL family protein N-acetyltransferase
MERVILNALVSDASPHNLRLRRLTSCSDKPIHLGAVSAGEFGLNMQLQTERLILHSFREEDVDAMAHLFANPGFMRFSLGVFTERKKTVEFIEKVMAWDREKMPSQFAVVLRGQHPVIGYCGFHHHAEVPGEIEIGYRLHPDYWNRGLITEAARAVRDHAFADLKLPRVISLIHPENTPSRRVAEKNGMKIEKEITFRGFPTLVYAITREQWLANRDAS